MKKKKLNNIMNIVWDTKSDYCQKYIYCSDCPMQSEYQCVFDTVNYALEKKYGHLEMVSIPKDIFLDIFCDLEKFNKISDHDYRIREIKEAVNSEKWNEIKSIDDLESEER